METQPLPTALTLTVDPNWVRAAVDQYEGPLTLYASRILRDTDRARDVVQETFLKLCGQDADVVNPRLAEWLFTVCRNHAVDVLRKERRMAPMTDGVFEQLAGNEPSQSERLERAETAQNALELLEQLPSNQREVIRLKFQNGFSYKEISAITGLSISHVGVLIHHGIKALRNQLLDVNTASASTSASASASAGS